MNPCETCAWIRHEDGLSALCMHDMSRSDFTETERSDAGNCGPSGRYWEPREEEE